MLDSGIPQGAARAPLLFMPYTIYEVLRDVTIEIKLVADHRIIHHYIVAPANRTFVNHNLKGLADWREKWRMTITTTKSAVITVSRKRTNDNYVPGITGKLIFFSLRNFF